MHTTLRTILEHRLIAVLRFNEGDPVIDVADAMIAGGIQVVEVTLTTPGALRAIAELATRPGVTVGAGSILSSSLALDALAAGAGFCASPIADADTIRSVNEAGAVSMPGAMTPTEIVAAWRAGGALIKVFPMPDDAVRYTRLVRGPLPEIPLAPSGGITPTTAPLLLAAGASALNVGSWLTHGSDGGVLPLAIIETRARALVHAVHRQ